MKERNPHSPPCGGVNRTIEIFQADFSHHTGSDFGRHEVLTCGRGLQRFSKRTFDTTQGPISCSHAVGDAVGGADRDERRKRLLMHNLFVFIGFSEYGSMAKVLETFQVVPISLGSTLISYNVFID